MERLAASKTATPIRRTGPQNRRALLDAANRLFDTHASVSMADVAREAGLTRATIYRHFPDRDALLDALCAELATQVLPEFFLELQGADLSLGMGVVGKFVATSFAQHRHLLAAIAPRSEQAARHAVTDDHMETYLRSRRTAGDLRVPQSDAYLSAAIRALCNAAAGDDRDTAQVAADLSETLRRVVGAGDDAGR